MSNKEIKKYDFVKTRKKVNDYMEQFEENYFRYLHLLPPSITSRIAEVKVQMTSLNVSFVEKYVIKKIESEEDFEEYLKLILDIVDNMLEIEQQFFKGIYFIGNTEEQLEEQFQCADKTLRHIKKSCIIKFALALHLDVLK